jgi:hypothetical protein
MKLSDIDFVGWCGIALVVFLGVGALAGRMFHKADRVVSDESRITRDLELEPIALAKIDADLRGLNVGTQLTALRNMLAWNELPSYITEEVVEQGIDAVERLIERTSFLRKQKAHDYAATGLVVTAH